MYVDRFQGDHIPQVEDAVGRPLTLHVGASPKILLTHLPAEERERIVQQMELKPLTSNTIKDWRELDRRSAEIRTHGYAVDEEDFEIGVYATGAPVRDHNGCVVAGVTVTTPAVRYTPQRRQERIASVVQAANRISG